MVDIREIEKKRSIGHKVPNLVATVLPKDKGEAQSKESTTNINTEDFTGKPLATNNSHSGDTQSDKYIEEIRAELVEKGYKDELYFSMLDAMVTKGMYIWEFKLLGKVPCAYTVRPDWVQQLLIKRVEEDAPRTIARFTDILNRYNLAGSIKLYGETTFALETEDSFKEILQFLGTLPFVTINALISELVIFDKAIAVAMSPWAIKNFTKPQSEK